MRWIQVANAAFWVRLRFNSGAKLAKKYSMGVRKPSFSWPVVEFVADSLDFVVVEAVEGGSLWQVLSDEPVHGLVGALFPRVVGMGEVVVHVEALGDGLVSGELLAVVGGDGVWQSLEGHEHFGGLVSEGLAAPVLEQRYPRDARRPVVGRESARLWFATMTRSISRSPKRDLSSTGHSSKLTRSRITPRESFFSPRLRYLRPLRRRWVCRSSPRRLSSHT